MIKSIKTWILVGFASLLLVACGQSGGGAGSKKSKTLDNTKKAGFCLLYTSPSPRDNRTSRMPSSA